MIKQGLNQFGNFCFYPQIDDAICAKCGNCVTICDESEHKALTMVDGHITVNKEACIGCSLCSHICAKSAIKMLLP